MLAATEVDTVSLYFVAETTELRLNHIRICGVKLDDLYISGSSQLHSSWGRNTVHGHAKVLSIFR